MFKKIKNLLAVLGLIVLLCAAFYYWGRLSIIKQDKAPEITAQVVLDKIVNQSFLVTKTLFLDTKADITVRDSSGFKGFFVGQKISAQGIVRVDVGQDFKKIKPEDIVIDRANKKVSIFFSGAEILDSSIFGDIKIENKKGLWVNVKELFKDDKSFEYNLSANELIAQANYAASDRGDFFQDADQSAASFISYIITDFFPEYSVELKKK